MKIIVRKLFRYQHDARTIRELPPGIYDVGKDISQVLCDLALSLSRAEIYVAPVFEKKAPENKVVEVIENKSTVAKKSGSRRSTRAKPNK